MPLTSLATLDALVLHNRGGLYEAKLFQALLSSPYVVRSAEFAALDGAVDCSATYGQNVRFAERFFDLWQAQRIKPHKLLLFEVKSTVGREAETQRPNFTQTQRTHAAFYICVNAANAAYVDLVPSHYHGSPMSSKIDKHYMPVSPRSYVLDPNHEACRMPIGKLPEAIENVRRVATGKAPHYVNPWSLVVFHDWQPVATHSSELMCPDESTPHFTSLLALHDLYRYFRAFGPESGVEMDFVAMQPRLADFKLIHGARQVLVQHKIDSRPGRSAIDRLEKVSIVRHGGGRDGGIIEHYFSDVSRFDFLWFQFEFVGSQIVFFFLPESVLPDSFYTTSERPEMGTVSFALEAFQQYRCKLDRGGQWVKQVRSIIDRTVHPRRRGYRPRRQEHSESVTAAVAGNAENAGSTASSQSVQTVHRTFYSSLMNVFASEGQDVLLPLPRQQYALVQYKWTTYERDNYFRWRRPPHTASTISPRTPILLLSLQTQFSSTSAHGPTVSHAMFQSIDASDSLSCLFLWDLGGSRCVNELLAPAIVPSVDLRPTTSQRLHYAETQAAVNSDYARAITLASLLGTGLSPFHYLTQSGPLIYDQRGCNWLQVVACLRNFFANADFRYPARIGPIRMPLGFVHTMARFNQYWYVERRRGGEVSSGQEGMPDMA